MYGKDKNAFSGKSDKAKGSGSGSGSGSGRSMGN
jgi:hypothetical protein